MLHLLWIPTLAMSAHFLRAESDSSIGATSQSVGLQGSTDATVMERNDTGLPTSPSDKRDIRESDYYRLESALLKNYRPHLRPVWSYNTTTNMSLILKIIAVHEVNEIYQTLRHSSYLLLKWTDQFLRWNPDHYHGQNFINLPTDSVWKPDVIFTGSVKGSGMVTSGQATFVYVTSEGEVIWAPLGMRETLCSMDITFYPFDTQICEINMEMWTSREKEVHIVSAEVNLGEQFHENSEWRLTSLEANMVSVIYDGSTFDKVIACLHLKRRRLFHCLTLIVPNVLLAFLAAFVFKLPSQSGEKVSYSMPLLLAFTLNLTVLIKTMPASSLNVSVLVLYLTSLSVITALSIIATAMTLRLYHRQQVLSTAALTAIRFLATFFRFKEASGRPKAWNVRNTLEDRNHVNDDQDADFISVPRKTFNKTVATDGSTTHECFDGSKDKVVITGCEAAMILDHAFFHTFILIIISLTFAFAVVMFVGKR